MAFSQPTKRRKKFAGPNPIGVAVIASKSWAPPAIETMADKDEKVICLYIDDWIAKQKLKKTLVDSGAIV